MSKFKLLALFATLIFSAATFAQAPPVSQQSQTPPPPPPSPCKTQPEYRQFDFWIGEWEVEVVGAPAGRPKPQSSIQLILGDCVIFENWMPPTNPGGKSFNLYNRVTKKWEQTWVDSSGGTIKFTGGLRDGNMTTPAKRRKPTAKSSSAA